MLNKLFVKNKKIILRIILICIAIIFLNAKINFAEDSEQIATLSNALTQEEENEIADFFDLQDMVGDIFDLTGNLGTKKLSDPINLMYSLIGRILIYWDSDFTKSTIYRLLVGITFMFLVANFSIKMYEENSAGLDLKVDSNLMIKKYIQFIFAIIMIFCLKWVVYFILGFFRFVLNLCINVTQANFIDVPEDIDILNKERVAYEILKQHGIMKTNTLLDEMIIRSKESQVRSQYMIPWVVSWISKLSLVVVIFVNSIKLFVHCVFYMLALGDFIGDLKNSKFLEYTKTLIALVLEEAVIVLVLYLSSLLLNPYLKELLTNGIAETNGSFLTLAMIFVGVSMSKVIVIISSSQISKKIIGVA